MAMKRRAFIGTAAGALAGARSWSIGAAQGANDRIRVGIIGCGNRGNQVATDWMKHSDTVFTAAAEVDRMRLAETAGRLGQTQGKTVDTVEDYRRILDRKDIDAVLIATPDHWHSPMAIDALSAGKDIYCEKPLSNDLDAAIRMLEATRRSKQIVQIGTQQRSWHHFQEAATLFKSRYIGESVNHVTMVPPVNAFRPQPPPPTAPQPIPDGFNWELFQGPAKRKPFIPQRRQWRGWYDYGGGNLTDWGVHLTDVMNWYMGQDTSGPLLTSASAQYVRIPRDSERVPDTYAVTWQYPTFVATLSNAMIPGVDDPRELYGNWFYGERGALLVNRMGYAVRPVGPQTAGGRPAAPNAPPPPPPPPPIEAKRFTDPAGMSETADSTFGSATHRHVRNFLDCVKSRRTPVCHTEVGFYATLPTLLAIISVKEGRTVRWDGKTSKAT
jgi:predicted dehydrogenase